MKKTLRASLSLVPLALAACGGSTLPPLPATLTTPPVTQARLVESPQPAGMLRVPGGTFELGSATGDAIERPPHSVTVSAFYIHRTEVTVLAYRDCQASNACTTPDAYDEFERPYCNWNATGREAHPVNCLDWSQANAFCRYIGARLPTEAEWEFAARGDTGRPYPWGTEAPDDTRLAWSGTTPREGTSTVGSFPAGASPFGVLDLSGNVVEWIGDWHGAFHDGAVTDPTGASFGETRGVRGGGWQAIRPDWVRATMRDGDTPTARTDDLGFRCAKAVMQPGP